MGNTYTRQSSFTDGDVITADLFNNEYDQLLAAFAASTGHTHDGTAAEGGPITKLLGTSITIGDGTTGTDITVTFDGESNDGELKWMEDEDYFEFSDDILVASDEKIQFRDTAIYINSSADGQLDLVADTEIQIAATTIDINGAADISGNLAVGGNLTVAGNATVTGTTTFNGGTLTLGDSASDNVVFGADVDSSIIPDDDDTYDLGSSSQQWRNIFIDGTAEIDTLAIDGTTVTATAAELNILDGVTATAAELNILDGVTSTAAELNILDGVTSTAAELNILDGATVVVGEINALDLGSTGTGTAINSKAVVLDANKDYTGIRNLTLTGDLTISGDDLTMGTNTSGHLLIADGTNFNPTAVGDLSEISTVANDDVFIAVDTSGGGLKKITRSTLVSGLAVSGAAISNVVEDTTPQLGGSLDVNGEDIVSVSNGNITLTPNGSGVVRIDGSNGIDMQSGAISIKNSGAESYVRFYCESSNAHYTQLQAAPHSAYSGNVTVVLPASADTLVGRATTDTLTNKTFGDNVSFGDNNITNVGDIALDSISADATDINIAVTDNSATAFTIKQGSDNYFVVDTGNSSESIAIGTGVSGTAITLGHSTSEVTVADNLTVTGDLTVSGTTTTVNSTTVNLNDHNIVLDSGNSTSAVINGAGITIEGGSGDDATFTYNTTGPKFELKLGSNHEDLQVDQLIAASLDISGDVDVDGTLEADAITVNGTALNTVIAGVTVTDATNAAHVLVTDNENTNEDNLITFVENATTSTGNVGLEMDGDLTYNPSTGNLTTTKVTANGGVVVDNITIDGTEIDLSSGDLTVDVAGDIILDAGGGDVKFAAAGTEILSVTNSSSDVIIKPIVDAKDIIFQQRDGTEVARVEDNGTFNVVTDKLAINGTAVTATAAELNLIDGGTSVGGSITLADADGFIVNDGGTMKTIPASDVKTYASGSSATKGFAIAMAIVFG